MFRDQHLGTALEYARGRIDVAHTIIPGFNATNTPTFLELPVWQALLALIFRACGTWFGWANILALLLFSSCLWPAYRLARIYSDERRSWWALIFFLAQPVIVVFSGYGGTDGFGTAMMVWFTYFAVELIRSGQLRFIAPAIVFAVLSVLTKAPFFVAAGIASFVILVHHVGWRLLRWWPLALVGLIAVCSLLAWTRFTEGVMANAEFPQMDLRLSKNPDLFYWYFGDLAYRLNPGTWVRSGWRFLVNTCGSFSLLAVIVGGFLIRRHPVATGWLIGSAISTAIFAHVVLYHAHYYAMYSFGLALLSAEAMFWLEQRLNLISLTRQIIFVAGVMMTLTLSAAQGVIAMETVLQADPYRRRVPQIVKEHTSPNDKLIIEGTGWGGETFILAERRGLSVYNTKLLDNPEAMRRLQELGYNKLVLISESPLLQAVEMTNPGNGGRERYIAHRHASPVTASWRETYHSDDVVIKEIPPAVSAQ